MWSRWWKAQRAPNPYGNQFKHGQVYTFVPPQFAKSLGQILSDVSFSHGCNYDVEPRSLLVPDQHVLESSSFLEEELNLMLSILKRKEETKRRLVAWKSQCAAIDSSHIAESQAPSNVPLAVVPMREPNLQVIVPNTNDVV
jgi:hypothetical protein